MADVNDTMQDGALEQTPFSGAEDLELVDPTSISALPTARAQSDRYSTAGILGEGAMGKVELLKDRWIGREIARKSLRDEFLKNDKAYKAFFREAKIQGQLRWRLRQLLPQGLGAKLTLSPNGLTKEAIMKQLGRR